MANNIMNVDMFIQGLKELGNKYSTKDLKNLKKKSSYSFDDMIITYKTAGYTECLGDVLTLFEKSIGIDRSEVKNDN